MAALTQGSTSVLINGEDTRCLDCADRGLQYGDGVFTTLTVSQGLPLFLPRHLKRLHSDATRLGIPIPAPSILEAEARRLSSLHPYSVLKIILTRGAGGRGYRSPNSASGTRILSAHPIPDYPQQLKEQGVKARFCAGRLGLNPRLAGIKHLNRLEQVLARAEWQDEEIREGLVLDYEGFLVEGVMSNVFLIRQGRLLTPLLDRCGVAGVMRGLVLEAARDLGIEAIEARLTHLDAETADELFLTNSVVGIWPVSQLDDKRFPVGDFTRQLAGRLDAMMNAELNRP